MKLSMTRLHGIAGQSVGAPLPALDDPRVREAAKTSDKVRVLVEREEQRLLQLEEFETGARHDGYARVAGVDEVGRGPLAGPLVAAAVVFESQPWIPLLNDSKKLSAEEREAVHVLICSRASAWAVGIVDVVELNCLNLHVASLEAMRRALNGLSSVPDHVLVDGCHVIPLIGCSQRALVRGDGRSLSIAAASIVAKVTRDRYMDEMDALWPGYGFAQHKGYGTPDHLRALRELGPTSIHRRRFRPVAQLQHVTSEDPSCHSGGGVSSSFSDRSDGGGVSSIPSEAVSGNSSDIGPRRPSRTTLSR